MLRRLSLRWSALAFGALAGVGTALIVRESGWGAWLAFIAILVVGLVVALETVPVNKWDAGQAGHGHRMADLDEGYFLADEQAMVIPRLVSPLALATKRLLDVSVAALVLLVLAPLLFAIAVAIRLDSAGPVFFRRLAQGRKSRPFRLLRFRTTTVWTSDEPMLVDLGEGGQLFPEMPDARLTRVGGFLRRTSLDELPQLINVLRGDMTLVGPRPIPVGAGPGYASREAALLADLTAPGLTGVWWLVRSAAASPEEVARLEAVYLANRSALADLRLLVGGRVLHAESVRRRALATLWSMGARGVRASAEAAARAVTTPTESGPGGTHA